MKKNIYVAIALIVGFFSLGAVSASADDSSLKGAACADKQAFQQFTIETSGLSSMLQEKKAELSKVDSYRGIEQGYEGADTDKISRLEAEVKELDARINSVAQKYAVSPFSRC